MINQFRMLLQDKTIKRFIFLNGFFVTAFIVIFVWKWSSLPPQLPLYYSLPRSPEQLGSPLSLFLLPFFSIIFSSINLTLAAILYSKERLASLILTLSAATASLLLFIAFAKIVFLVS